MRFDLTLSHAGKEMSTLRLYVTDDEETRANGGSLIMYNDEVLAFVGKIVRPSLNVELRVDVEDILTRLRGAK